MKLDPVARSLIAFGILIVVVGLAWQLGWIQHLRLGRLPGDIVVERENFKFYFLITTGLLVSAALTFVAWLFRNW